MKKKEKIRVIKKGVVKINAEPEITEEKSKEDETARLSSTVSGWIAETKQRRREETETAMERFGY